MRRRLATLGRMLAASPRGFVHRHALAAGLAVCVLALGACHRAPPPPSNATPEKAVATNLRLTAAGDFDGLMKNRLPPADYAAWREEWDKAHAAPVPASVVQQQQFAKVMQMLTAPDAEASLAKRLLPQLAHMRGKDSSMPILGGVLAAAGKQLIATSPQLGPAQRRLAGNGLDALAAWANSTDFSDAGKAKKAIAIVCTAARDLHVQTLAQWRALDYPATMRAYGTLWKALEQVLNVYGLDIAGSLNRAKMKSVTAVGDQASVRINMSFAGETLTAEWPMRRQGGHWYDAALLDAWRAAHSPPPARVEGATAGSAAPAATTGMPNAGVPAAAASVPLPAPKGDAHD